MRLSAGLLKDEKKSFASLKEILELLQTREMSIDTDDPQFIKFPKYGVVEILMNGLFLDALRASKYSTKNWVALSVFPFI